MATIKSYKEVINYFEKICNSHMSIHQFQSGMFSDIDVQTNNLEPTQYPLVFLVHRAGSIEGNGKQVFSFTLLVMDISTDQEDLETNRLSDTHDILQDIISKVILTSATEVDINLSLPIATTPFVERYNNKLTGWAAEIDVEVKSPLNLCYSAFN